MRTRQLLAKIIEDEFPRERAQAQPDNREAIDRIVKQFMDEQVGLEVVDAYAVMRTGGQYPEITVTRKSFIAPNSPGAEQSREEWKDMANQLCDELERANFTHYQIFSTHQNGFMLMHPLSRP